MVGVLLVEDDSAIASIYAWKLRSDGYAVTVAADQAEADRAFWGERPSVVCLDERLPDGPGTDLACRFTAAGARVMLFTNDQRCYERPPEGVCRVLLKANTSPAQLSAVVSELASRASLPA